MPIKNSPTKYNEGFKKTIVTIYQFGKTYANIKKEYDVFLSAHFNWIKKYSKVQVTKALFPLSNRSKLFQLRNTELEEKNLI